MIRIDFVGLKGALPLLTVLDHIGWTWRRKTPLEMRGYCPIHSGKGSLSTCFKVSHDRWYCHKCRTGGDVVRLWSELHHLSQYQAALALIELFAVVGVCSAPPTIMGTGERHGSRRLPAPRIDSSVRPQYDR